MKRRAILAMVLAAMLVFATGCGSSEKVIEGSSQTGTTQSGGENAESTASADADEDAKENQESQDTQEESQQEKGYVFYYNGVAVVIDAEADPVVEALGDPVSYYEATSCAFEGLDKIYTYSSFEIDTYPMEDVDYISMVVLMDDSVSTAEGITIGDSREKLTEVYGEGTDDGTGAIIYEKDGMTLRFILQNEAVASIEYLSNVL